MSTRQLVILTLLACSTFMLSLVAAGLTRKAEVPEARVEALEIKLSEDVKP